MAQPNQISGDLIVTGNAKFGSMQTPVNSIGDAQHTTADPLTTDKQYHRFQVPYSQKRGIAIAADTGTVIHVARKDGTVEGFWAGFTVDDVAWTGSAAVDLKKNGVSILSGVVTIDGANVIFVPEAQTIATPGYVSGDVFEVVVGFTAGTGTPAQGLFAQAQFSEKPS